MSINQFAKGKVNLRKVSNRVVIYTRVSTKEQADNNQSLQTQLSHCSNYAIQNKLEVVATCGGTYESAKNDERKEFNRMLTFVKKSNLKIGTILVYSLDRFSRSGANSIHIAQKLKETGISIQSVTQPTDSQTSGGTLQQNIYMSFSEYENHQRKEKCMAGIKAKLLKGQWVTKPPLGYDTIKENGTRKYLVNATGKILAKAFKMKANLDLPTSEISDWLKKRGVKVNSKRLYELLQNPFYCGFLSHAALEGEVVPGNQEKLVSEEVFLKINNMAAQRRHKNVKASDYDDNLPLKRFIICDECNTPFVGYLVRKRNLFYYKCNKKGCKCNRNATILHEKFKEILSYYTIDPNLTQYIQEMIRRKIKEEINQQPEEKSLLKNRIKELNKKIEKLEERHALGDVDKEIFQKYKAKYLSEIDAFSQEMEESKFSLSNIEKSLKKATNMLSNLNNMWELAPFYEKQRMQNILFPEGILFNKEKNHYRTLRVNSALHQIALVSRVLGDKKQKIPSNFAWDSAWVARSRIELPTSGL